MERPQTRPAVTGTTINPILVTEVTDRGIALEAEEILSIVSNVFCRI